MRNSIPNTRLSFQNHTKIGGWELFRCSECTTRKQLSQNHFIVEGIGGIVCYLSQRTSDGIEKYIIEIT